MAKKKLVDHPAASAWPLFPQEELRRLADDIKTNGQLHPVVLDAEGRVLDGRNRLAACKIAGVEPTFETYDSDPEAYVLSANNQRRHMSLPERAAATGLTLSLAGRRKNGRWEYGSVGETVPENQESLKSGGQWNNLMSDAGLVFDYLGEARLKRVAHGKEALDSAVQAAKKEREHIARFEALLPEMQVLVEAGEMTVEDAERRLKLDSRHLRLVESGDLSLDEAETLSSQEAREHREGIERSANSIDLFMHGYEAAATLYNAPHREEVLAVMDEYDRKRFLKIEKESFLWMPRKKRTT